MQERPAKPDTPAIATQMNVQSALTGLRGRDLLSTLRQVGQAGLRNPLHAARHVLSLGSALGRVMLGDTPLQPHPRDPRFSDLAWTHNPLYRRGGTRRFVLANSGHIQSIINPPSNAEAHYFDNPEVPLDPRAWLHDARRNEGSWWPLWLAWISQRSGALKPPRHVLGNASYPLLDPAPGRYVQVR